MASLLPSLAEALSPVRDLSARYLPPGWQETPGFTLVFGALFLVSLAGWWQVDIPRRKAALLASCSMSILHGWLCSTGAYQQLLAWPRLELDLPNSAAQVRRAAGAAALPPGTVPASSRPHSTLPALKSPHRPNRPQTRLAEFSLAYMTADFVFYLLPWEPGDLKFVVHHVISAFYLVA